MCGDEKDAAAMFFLISNDLFFKRVNTLAVTGVALGLVSVPEGSQQARCHFAENSDKTGSVHSGSLSFQMERGSQLSQSNKHFMDRDTFNNVHYIL